MQTAPQPVPGTPSSTTPATSAHETAGSGS